MKNARERHADPLVEHAVQVQISTCIVCNNALARHGLQVYMCTSSKINIAFVSCGALVVDATILFNCGGRKSPNPNPDGEVKFFTANRSRDLVGDLTSSS